MCSTFHNFTIFLHQQFHVLKLCFFLIGACIFKCIQIWVQRCSSQRFFFCIKNKHFMLSFFSSCHSSASLNKSITSSTAVSSAHFFDVFQKPLRFISQQRGYIFYVQSGRSCSFIAGRFFLRKKTPGGGLVYGQTGREGIIDSGEEGFGF